MLIAVWAGCTILGVASLAWAAYERSRARPVPIAAVLAAKLSIMFLLVAAIGTTAQTMGLSEFQSGFAALAIGPLVTLALGRRITNYMVPGLFPPP